MGDGRDKPVVVESKTDTLLNGGKVDVDNKLLHSQAAQDAFGPRNQAKIDDELKRKAGVYETKVEETDFDKLLAAWRPLRLGVATFEAAAYTIPGAAMAAIHDVSHPLELAEKSGTAFTLGVAMRTALPKSGAGRVAAAGLFGYYMVKDALVPVAQGYSEVWDESTTTHADVHRSAQKMGGGLGMMGWDFYLGGKIAGAGEHAAEAGWKRALGDERFAAWDKRKLDWWTSDEKLVGRNINRGLRALDKTTASISDALVSKPPSKPTIGLEEARARIKAAEGEYGGKVELMSIHKIGFKGTDGKGLGLSESVDMLENGKDPRKMSRAEVDAAGKELQTDTYLLTHRQSGLVEARKPLLLVEGGEVKVVKDGKVLGPETPAAVPKTGSRVALEVNETNLSDFARMTKEEMGKRTDEQQQMADFMDSPRMLLGAALKPTGPLDPGYNPINLQVNGLHDAVIHPAGGKGPTPEDFQQVAPLFLRMQGAAIGHLGLLTGATGANIGSMNRMSHELYTGYARKIADLGLNPNEVLAAKNPPLNLIAFDNGAGPHTLPQIDGVWNVDLVHWPRNMENLKILRAGIQGHENIHDQYGGILRFADSIRENVINDSVGKALGTKAQEMVDIPGHGQMSKRDLIVAILKAQANENTADMGGAAWTGTNGALSLGVLLQGLRSGGKLETRNVFGKDFVSSENPLGFEVHGMDAWRIKLVAEVVRQRSGGDKTLLEHADALDKYADAASRGGDYTWANMDVPGQKITLSKADFEAVIPELVKAQFNTPLAALKGKTYADIVPDLPTQMRKMDQIADLIADAVTKKKPLESIPFDTKDYTMIQLLGAGLPAALRLRTGGMTALEASLEVNRVSDFLEKKLHASDPHIDPLDMSPKIGTMIKNPAVALNQLKEKTGNLIGKQPEGRDLIDRNAHKVVGYAGMHWGRELFQTYDPNWMANAFNPPPTVQVDKPSGDKPGDKPADKPGASLPGTDKTGDGKPGFIKGDGGAVVVPLNGDKPSGEAGRERTIRKPEDPFLRPRGNSRPDFNVLYPKQGDAQPKK